MQTQQRSSAPRFTLSAFGDEIADDLAKQLDTLEAVGISQLDLRGVWGRNVIELTDEEVSRVGEELARREMRVACVASPIGKAPVAADVAPQLAALERAIAIAQALDTRYVRIFSWYIPAGDEPERYREIVLDHLSRMNRLAETHGVTLLHENERGIYGATPQRCHDLLAQIDSPSLRAVWDPGNFVACGVDPQRDAYDLLRPWIAYVHVKDVVAATGQIVVAGAGDAGWREGISALHASGFSGVLALEPHLVVAGVAAGFSGPDRFREAAAALTGLLAEQGITFS